MKKTTNTEGLTHPANVIISKQFKILDMGHWSVTETPNNIDWHSLSEADYYFNPVRDWV